MLSNKAKYGLKALIHLAGVEDQCLASDIAAYGRRLTSFIGVFEVELSRQLSKKGDRNGLRAA